MIECAGTLIGSAERVIECVGTPIASCRNQRSNARNADRIPSESAIECHRNADRIGSEYALHDAAVEELISAHQRRVEEPLVLAVRFDREDAQDIHLLEVLGGFPGGEEDELLVTEFAPSAQLRVLGKLHLTLGSPAQLQAAVARHDAQTERFKNGTVVHDDGSPEAEALRKLLGL